MQINNKNIIKILEKTLDGKLPQIDKLLDDGVLDSLAMVMVIEELENTFSIEISPTDFTHLNFNSVKSISEMLERIIV